MSEREKEVVKYRIERSSYGDKIRDFQKWNEAVKKKILYSVRNKKFLFMNFSTCGKVCLTIVKYFALSKNGYIKRFITYLPRSPAQIT